MAPKVVPVAAGVLMQYGKILIAKRRSGERLAGYWEFPGGKIEAGETSAQCLRRELREELAIETEVGEFLMKSRFDYPAFSIELHVHFATIVSGEPRLLDHDEIAWVSAGEMRAFRMAPADLPVIDELIRRLGP